MCPVPTAHKSSYFPQHYLELNILGMTITWFYFIILNVPGKYSVPICNEDSKRVFEMTSTKVKKSVIKALLTSVMCKYNVNIVVAGLISSGSVGKP